MACLTYFAECIKFEAPTNQTFRHQIAETKNPAPGRVFRVTQKQSAMFVFVFVLVLMAAARMGFAAVGTQVVANRATRRAAEACADGRTGGAAQAVADY